MRSEDVIRSPLYPSHRTHRLHNDDSRTIAYHRKDMSASQKQSSSTPDRDVQASATPARRPDNNPTSSTTCTDDLFSSGNARRSVPTLNLPNDQQYSMARWLSQKPKEEPWKY